MYLFWKLTRLIWLQIVGSKEEKVSRDVDFLEDQALADIKKDKGEKMPLVMIVMSLINDSFEPTPVTHGEEEGQILTYTKRIREPPRFTSCHSLCLDWTRSPLT